MNRPQQRSLLALSLSLACSALVSCDGTGAGMDASMVTDGGVPQVDSGPVCLAHGDLPLEGPYIKAGGTFTHNNDACWGECGDALYTECTCAPRNICSWDDDGFCDKLCNAVVDESFDDSVDCGPSCPPLCHEAVRYLGDDEAACAGLALDCDAASERSFNNRCGCGCISMDPTCPDPTAPEVHYAADSYLDPAICYEIGDLPCVDGQDDFFDEECGCGCIDFGT